MLKQALYEQNMFIQNNAQCRSMTHPQIKVATCDMTIPTCKAHIMRPSYFDIHVCGF